MEGNLLATIRYQTCCKRPDINGVWRRFTQTDVTEKVTFLATHYLGNPAGNSKQR